MLFANRFNDPFKHFTHYVSDTTLERFVFLWRGSILNSPNAIIHLVVNVEECLKNVLCGLWVFKQGRLRDERLPLSMDDNALCLVYALAGNLNSAHRCREQGLSLAISI
jgi:hypothetical protein